MSGIQAALLPDGRLHLQHGPIDLIIGAFGEAAAVARGFAAARACFDDRAGKPWSRSCRCCAPRWARHRRRSRVLSRGASSLRAGLSRRLHHADGRGRRRGRRSRPRGDHRRRDARARLRQRRRRHRVSPGTGRVAELRPGRRSRGARNPWQPCGSPPTCPCAALATSGRACKGNGGRSFSFGIADCRDGARVRRRRGRRGGDDRRQRGRSAAPSGGRARAACDIDPDSDLGSRLVTWDVGALTATEIDAALAAGRARAKSCRARWTPFLGGVGIARPCRRRRRRTRPDCSVRPTRGTSDDRAAQDSSPWSRRSSTSSARRRRSRSRWARSRRC